MAGSNVNHCDSTSHVTMTKLVAGNVLGWVTSPQQFVSVFVTMLYSSLQHAQQAGGVIISSLRCICTWGYGGGVRTT